MTSYDIKSMGSTAVTKERARRGSRRGKFWWKGSILGPVVSEPYVEDVSLEVSVGLAVEEPQGGARGAKEQRTALGGSVSVALSPPPHACSPCFKCLAAWDRGDCFPFSSPPPHQHLGLHQTFRSGKENCYGNM